MHKAQLHSAGPSHPSIPRPGNLVTPFFLGGARGEAGGGCSGVPWVLRARVPGCRQGGGGCRSLPGYICRGTQE